MGWKSLTLDDLKGNVTTGTVGYILSTAGLLVCLSLSAVL